MSLLSRQVPQSKALSVPFKGGFPSYQFVDGRLVSIADNPESYIRSAYDINDIIYSIVKLIMDKIKVAPWGVYTVKDETALKQLHGMQRKAVWSPKDFILAKGYQRKAFELAKNPGKLGELMKYPNEYETMPEMVANGAGYRLLVGNQYVWGKPLKGGANAGLPFDLWNLPAQWTQIKATDTFPTKVTGYYMSVGNIDFPAEEIMHIKEWNPNWNINGDQLYGMSPLKAALGLTNRSNSSMDASAALFQNKGISGILAMENQVGNVDGDLALEEVKKLKETMVREWQGERNRGKMGLSGYSMQWLPIGMTTEEMQLIESEKWDLRRLCSVFGVQSQLLNDPDNKTYANQEEAEKALTTRCALPALTAFRDNFNRKLRTNWGGQPGQIVDFDMSVYSELQQDMGDMATWLEKLMNKGFPLNRALDLMNLEQVDKIFDESWITQGMGQPQSEWELNPVDNELNTDNSDGAGAGEGNL